MVLRKVGFEIEREGEGEEQTPGNRRVGDIQEELGLDLQVELPAVEREAGDQDHLHDNDDNEEGKEQPEHLHNVGGVVLFRLQGHHGGLDGVQLEPRGDQRIQLRKDVGHKVVGILIRELRKERKESKRIKSI